MSVQHHRQSLDELPMVFDLKFRKIMVRMEDETWIALDRYAKNKITTFRQLNYYLEKISVEKKMNVARVYHSLNEFFNAKELRSLDKLSDYTHPNVEWKIDI